MRRLGRKPIGAAAAIAGVVQRIVRWVPRQRRIRMSGQVQYRSIGAELWSAAELVNISRSGLLFQSTEVPAMGTLVELEVDMPPEICGGLRPQRVKSVAQVVRTEQSDSHSLCAVKLFDYAFVDTLYTGDDGMAPSH